MTWHLLRDIAVTILVLWAIAGAVVWGLIASYLHDERRIARKQAECAGEGCVDCGLGLDAAAFDAHVRDVVRVTR